MLTAVCGFQSVICIATCSDKVFRTVVCVGGSAVELPVNVSCTAERGLGSSDRHVAYYEGESTENRKSAIKIRNTARLSCKLTTVILMVRRVADRWQYDTT